ncbi:hypothetical protein FKX85_06685 [Echinicola soli]|uniref:Uncharacterized protein n=1 Tax=Echinicola soli TaxID=2591634 RepID=A0A514CG09_9BACT|nr:hypothetical protein [Echinicola soli]QDH78738.1 hypothetical protein FKX85_06685 [Echinicola soli]
MFNSKSFVMKKYPINFLKNYAYYKEYLGKDSPVEISDKMQERIDFCKKWTGKEVTMLDIQENLEEIKRLWDWGFHVVFDGDSIWVVDRETSFGKV